MPNPQYIWTLSNATVATISSSGLLLARTLGTTFVFFFFFLFQLSFNCFYPLDLYTANGSSIAADGAPQVSRK